MGLWSWLAGLFGGTDSPDADADAGVAADDDGSRAGLAVDVERRAGAIFEHYDLSPGEAREVAEILSEEVGREEGYARPMIVDRVREEVGLDEELATRLVDTEVASIRNLARVREYRGESDGEPRFRWVDSVDRDDSPVCADVRAAIDERGEAVTADELRRIIRDAAADHEEGTPDRADDLVPHEECRHTVVRHFEE